MSISITRMRIFKFSSIISFLFSFLEFSDFTLPICQPFDWRICSRLEYLLFDIKIFLLTRVGSFIFGIFGCLWTALDVDVLINFFLRLLLLSHIIILHGRIFIRVSSIFDTRCIGLAKSGFRSTT